MKSISEFGFFAKDNLKITFDQLNSGFVKKRPYFKSFVYVGAPSEVNRRATVSRKEKWIYFRVGKAANSTILSSLHFASSGRTLKTLEDVKHAKRDYQTVGDLEADEVNQLSTDFTKFTFVRHPRSRFMSCYLDKIFNGDYPVKAKVSRYLRRHVTDPVSIDEFLDYLESGGLQKDGHWAPQTDWISYPIGDLDYVGRVETLERDFKKVSELIFGKSTPLVKVVPHATKSVRQIHTELSFEQIDRVNRLYDKDFAILGYTDDLS